MSAPKPLKVYGWGGFRNGKQTRVVTLAASKAEINRLFPDRRAGRPDWNYGGETWNEEERAAAEQAGRGSIAWRPLNWSDGTEWTIEKVSNS
ncbi:hypothetical protein SEA_ABBA_46 [Arthrobacter phage Abba]|uniref:Uncharacterized protein n=1 Tax=Arthrobacter phage Abba TaxID=2713256 RepID=A0A6G8R2D4_9CAUD|nr:hypothetical protein HYQ28_gp46 [Arthrobacter phage Abba]QIN94375.1 hypothetical protein SEA_ABBA_46 [Arthrobacter phage Abba]